MSTMTEALQKYGFDAFLITQSKTGPHTSQVTVRWENEQLTSTLGHCATVNIKLDPSTSLLWPPKESGGYCLIVNSQTLIQVGQGSTRAYSSIFKAVLHRLGDKPVQEKNSAKACLSDCIPVVL